MLDQTVIESIEGTTHIELFRAPALDTSMEASEECFQIADALNLPKQRDAYKTDTSTIPWPQITKTEISVYAVCFPESKEIENYDQPIPLTVLREIEKASKINVDGKQFWKFIILSPVSGSLPDPVLLGYYGEKDKAWYSKPYILARWGSALLPFDQLTKFTRDKVRSVLARRAAEIKAELALLEETPPGEWKIELPTYSHTQIGEYRSVL